jgi:membrane protein YqaA with SNARE-associated domain
MDGRGEHMENIIESAERKNRVWWNPFDLLHNLYDWVLHWAETPYGVPALFVLAFAESSFFPLPPDILLIALAISIPTRAFRYALVCTLGSVIGGTFGYLIGWQFYEVAGEPIVHFYHGEELFADIQQKYLEYGFWFVFTAGFTPIPYKIFTIASGVFTFNFWKFIIASSISRSARFFLVAALIWLFGPKIKPFIDKYFNVVVILFTILLIGGFMVIKWVYPMLGQ